MQQSAVAEVLDEIDAAIFLGILVSDLQALRCRGSGPSYMRVGRLIRYQRTVLIAFQKSCTVNPTVEAAARDGAR